MIKFDKQGGPRSQSGDSAGQTNPTGGASEVAPEHVEATNTLIADGFALYEKTKAFDLSAGSRHESRLQVLFDEQAMEIFTSIDTLAEEMRRIGAATLRSISHSGELRSLDRSGADTLSGDEMAEELIADNRQFAKAITDAKQICEKLDCLVAGLILQDLLDKTERQVKELKRGLPTLR